MRGMAIFWRSPPRPTPTAEPAYTGISLFAAEKGAPGLTVSRDIKKLGYKGLDTCELPLRLSDTQPPR